MNIEKFCEKYNFGTVLNISKLSGGLMHKMFKVETDKGIYCIKVLNPEVMARDTAYNNFVVSESVSNLAKKNNIPYTVYEKSAQLSIFDGTGNLDRFRKTGI